MGVTDGEQAGLSPRAALHAALNDWAEQVRFERTPTPADVFGVPLALREWAILEELVAAARRGDLDGDE